MSNSIDYQGSSVGPACSYTTLGTYNSHTPGTRPAVPKKQQQTQGHYVVPEYQMPGYATLTHGGAAPSCTGFFNIDNAYKTKGGNCNQKYTRRMCQ